MMSGIRGKNTQPELAVRRALFAAGYRFRLHRRDLPGAPDVVLPGRKVAIFVHGCFWHRHPGCRFATTPSTRPDFWKEKFEKNVVRDGDARDALTASGWRVLVCWECGTRNREFAATLSTLLREWIEGEELVGEISPVERADEKPS
jgi:DNA mismatch endonuclease (patch repair protein)